MWGATVVREPPVQTVRPLPQLMTRPATFSRPSTASWLDIELSTVQVRTSHFYIVLTLIEQSTDPDIKE